MSDGMAVNNEILMQKIATYYSYEQQHNMFQNEECKFIGYIDSNPGNYQININPNIEKYVKENLSEKIKNEANIENAIRQEEIIKNHKEIKVNKVSDACSHLERAYELGRMDVKPLIDKYRNYKTK